MSSPPMVLILIRLTPIRLTPILLTRNRRTPHPM
jgi:hypothetical protein